MAETTKCSVFHVYKVCLQRSQNIWVFPLYIYLRNIILDNINNLFETCIKGLLLHFLLFQNLIKNHNFSLL